MDLAIYESRFLLLEEICFANKELDVSYCTVIGKVQLVNTQYVLENIEHNLLNFEIRSGSVSIPLILNGNYFDAVGRNVEIYGQIVLVERSNASGLAIAINSGAAKDLLTNTNYVRKLEVLTLKKLKWPNELLLHFELNTDIEILWSKEWQKFSSQILSDNKWFENYISSYILSKLNKSAYDWELLWNDYVKRVHKKYYNFFKFAHYKYLEDVSCSLRHIERDPESSSESSEDLSDDLEEMKILGLPTSFGVITQNKMAKIKTEEKSKQKKKKISRKLRKLPEMFKNDKVMLKYWRKRFSLFSRFDEGITMDRESWFSVTPEKIASHMAERLSCDIIVDGFCGCGGNAIQFAKHCKRVIAIDIDASKIEMARQNATIYGVADKIDFIVADFLQLSGSGKFCADVVFLSPPWGGPEYKKTKSYDIEKSLLPTSATKLFECAGKISSNIAIFLPRNTNMQQIIKLAGVGNKCEVEHNYLDNRLIGITAFYGQTVKL